VNRERSSGSGASKLRNCKCAAVFCHRHQVGFLEERFTLCSRVGRINSEVTGNSSPTLLSAFPGFLAASNQG
jgi:hypothetical protein